MTDSNRTYILELFKIVNTTSILVIDHKGTLRRLHCPFKVIAIVGLPPHIIVEALYLVDAVKMNLELKEVFIIEGKGYLIWHFNIVI